LENVSAEACRKFGTKIQKALALEEVKMTWHKIGDMDIAQAFGVDLSNLNSRSTKRLKKLLCIVELQRAGFLRILCPIINVY